MSITNAAGVEFARRLGINRVVLARELSLEEISAIKSQTDVELEMFVHGALCVSYSGQCFSSEAWGGRSANRGQCAQACRLPYELMVDGVETPLGDARYLLNSCEILFLLETKEKISAEKLLKIISKRAAHFDKKGDFHFNLISAFHKSLRGSDVDAALLNCAMQRRLSAAKSKRMNTSERASVSVAMSRVGINHL
jgi:hypothetical protein